MTLAGALALPDAVPRALAAAPAAPSAPSTASARPPTSAPPTAPSAPSTPAPPTSAPPAAPAGPDLANLHDLMTWLARQSGPRLSFLDPRWKSLTAWKAQARPELLRRLAYDPPAAKVSAQVQGREERDGLIIESVRISATEAYDIPAKVLLPARRTRRLPGVVALHCHSGKYQWGHEKLVSQPGEPAALTTFRNGTYGRPWAEALARRGYLVVVIDAFYFGSRRLQVEALDPATSPSEARDLLAALASVAPGSEARLTAIDRLCGRYEHLTAKTIFASGATWPGILAWDDRRSVDYLASRPEVDPDRLGCLGLSIGGLRTAHLIGVDPRIRAACVVGWMTEFALQLRNHLRSHTWMAYIPGLYRSLDLPDVAALIAPGALLVQQCSRDNLYPLAAMQAVVSKLERIYTKAGHRDRFQSTFHDVPHSFRPDMQDQAFAWLDRWLTA
jgi:dienelactone hydrolase